MPAEIDTRPADVAMDGRIVTAAAISDEHPFRHPYRAFISYSRAEIGSVRPIFRTLTGFRLPPALMKLDGGFGPAPSDRIRVFLDEASLEPGDSLANKLHEKLDQSAFLIVFCSARSKASRYVEDEITYFLSKNPVKRVFPVLMWQDERKKLDDILPLPLMRLLESDQLPLGVEWFEGAHKTICNKLLAGLLGLTQDQVAREQEIADRNAARRRMLAAGALATVSLLAAIGFGWGYFSAKESERRGMQSRIHATLAASALQMSAPLLTDLVAKGRVKYVEAEPHVQALDQFLSDVKRRDVGDVGASGIVQAIAVNTLANASRLNAELGRTKAWRDQAEGAFVLAKALPEDLQSLLGENDGLLIQIGKSHAQRQCLRAMALAPAAAAMNDFQTAESALDTCRQVVQTLLARGREEDQVEQQKLLLSTDFVAFALSLERQDFPVSRRLLKQIQDRKIGHDDTEAGRNETLFWESVGVYAEGELALKLGSLRRAQDELTRARSGFQQVAASADERRWPGRRANATYHAEQIGRVLLQIESEFTPSAAGAVAEYRAMAEREKRDALQDPAWRQRKAQYAATLVLMAETRFYNAANLDQAPLALSELSEAAAELKVLLEYDSRNLNWLRQMAALHRARAGLLFRLWEGKIIGVCAGSCIDAAVKEIDAALAILDGQELAEAKDNASLLAERIGAHLLSGRYLRERGDGARAELEIAKAEALFAAYQGEHSVRWQILDAMVQDERADLHCLGKGDRNALGKYRKSVALFSSLLKAEPGWLGIHRDLIWENYRLATCAAKLGNAVETVEAFRDACTAIAQAPAEAFSRALALRDREKVRLAARDAGHPCSETR